MFSRCPFLNILILFFMAYFSWVKSQCGICIYALATYSYFISWLAPAQTQHSSHKTSLEFSQHSWFLPALHGRQEKVFSFQKSPDYIPLLLSYSFSQIKLTFHLPLKTSCILQRPLPCEPISTQSRLHSIILWCTTDDHPPPLSVFY